MTDKVQFLASLDTVGTENYIRYGVSGPQRYLKSSNQPTIPTPTSIQILISLIAADEKVMLALDAFSLQRSEHIPDNRTIWSGTHQNSQWVWVWDFYRMLSILTVEPAPDLAALLPQCHRILIRVDNQSAQITQSHPCKV
ncbi:MAG: hypothetical protein H6673_07435 [Anaerolineales bacterium]|nr:hypothetical protein [Anaerolineales bacterium]